MSICPRCGLDLETVVELLAEHADLDAGETAMEVISALRKFKTAEQLFSNEKYEKAAAEYVKLVNQAPDHENAPRALNNAAVAYENIKKYESAMKLYERVYREYPQDPLAAYALYRVGVNSERFFDYDNDGDLDLFVSGYSAGVEDVAADYLARPHDAAFPRLYKNRGDGTFEDATLAAGLDEVMLSMGSNYGDLDNDGYLDFYVGTGDPDLRMLVPNRMFRNDRGAQFEEITSSGGFGHLQKGHGVSFADLDNDGDQDVHAVMGGAYEGDVYQNVLFENPGHDRRFVKLLLQGTQSNRSAVGARLHVEVEEASGSRRAIHRVVGTGGSFGGSPLRQEIGLGEAVRIAKVEVWWPTTGERERFEGVSMDGLFRLVEGSGRAEPLPLESFVFARGAAAHEGHSMHGMP